MKKYLLISGLFLLASCSKDGHHQSIMSQILGTTAPAYSPEYVYLLMGQSNMGDRCLGQASNYIGAPGCSTGEALGPVINDPKALFVQCSVGGTFMARWIPGGDLYQHCLANVPNLPVKGVFFFQGEADAIEPSLGISQWNLAFSGMVQDLRNHFTNSSLPVVFAQIGSGNSSLDWIHIQDEQASVNIPHVSMVITSDLTPYDSVHFDQAEYSLIAQRMWSAFKLI